MKLQFLTPALHGVLDYVAAAALKSQRSIKRGMEAGAVGEGLGQANAERCCD